MESSSFEVTKNEELTPVLCQLVSQMTMLNAVASSQKEIINAIKASGTFWFSVQRTFNHRPIQDFNATNRGKCTTFSYVCNVCIKLPDKVVRETILGECINLIDFLPDNDIILSEQYENPVDLPQGVMVVRPKKNKRNIDNFDVWLTAWNNYEALLVQNHPDIYPNIFISV